MNLDHFFLELAQSDQQVVLSTLFDLSLVQDSFSFRAEARAKRLAEEVLDNHGEWHLKISLDEPFYPRGYHDAVVLQRHRMVLERLVKTPQLLSAIKKIRLPLCHRFAEQLIRSTVHLPAAEKLQDLHVHRAVLMALFSPLRQTVGSCFATAPALLVHEQQLEIFLADLNELLSTGRLKRVSEGVEYGVPMSPSTGVGDLRKPVHVNLFYSPGLMAGLTMAGILKNEWGLEKKMSTQRRLLAPLMGEGLTVEQLLDRLVSEPKRHEAKEAFKRMVDNPLLKTWEYTLASFSEAKMEFSRWNLYSCLGLNHQVDHGIGQLLFNEINHRLQAVNQNLGRLQRDYESANDQYQLAASLLRKATSESEGRRAAAEYQARAHHMQSCLDMHKQAQAEAAALSQFFSFLIRQYDEKFPDYFQEIYDPEMGEYRGDQYNDSPAGFRLVCKHGRIDPSVWTLIYTTEQFIKGLVEFFTLTETPIADLCETAAAKQLLGQLTTLVIQQVRSDRFLEEAIRRLSKEDRKPWAYISGGTMDTLVKIYFRKDQELQKESRWVESEADLLIFILDTLKSLPPKIIDPYLRDDRKGMLMQSPTHAFVLYPGWQFFKEGWHDDGFSYTWVRDQVVIAGNNFYYPVRLSTEEQRFLIEKLHLNSSPSQEMTIEQFRDEMLKQGVEQIDSFLYRMVPLIPAHRCQEELAALVSPFTDLLEVPFSLPPFLGVQELLDMAKACVLKAHSTHRLTFDLQKAISDRAVALGLVQRPLLFADSNWSQYYLGFLVNPGTGRLELWRIDRTGSIGAPMTQWKPLLDGTKKEPWIIYPSI